MNKQIITVLLLGMCLLSSCSYLIKEEDKTGTEVARVGVNYLYEDDIASMVTEGISPEDSTLVVTNYINSWAANQLLVSKAKINLNDNKLKEFDRLVEAYKQDLYINAYKEALVSKSVDTVVNFSEMEQYYNNHQENFKLNEELVKLKYIHVPAKFSDKDELIKHFSGNSEDNLAYLDSITIQFKSYNLNDSVWVKYTQIINKISAITSDNKPKYLKKSQFFELEDSLGVYLVKIKDVLFRNDNAPLSYIEPTIRQIIINQRKLEFMRNLERDVLEEAIKKSEFEVYND